MFSSIGTRHLLVNVRSYDDDDNDNNNNNNNMYSDLRWSKHHRYSVCGYVFFVAKVNVIRGNTLRRNK